MKEQEGPQEHEGKLSISRVSGGENYIEIRLEDANAHVLVTRIKVPLESFGAIVTGLSLQPVKYEAHNFDKLGKVMEHKTERVIVDCENYYDKFRVIHALELALPAYEIDGWTAEVSSSLSQQNSCGVVDGKVFVNVHFRRYV